MAPKPHHRVRQGQGVKHISFPLPARPLSVTIHCSQMINYGVTFDWLLKLKQVYSKMPCQGVQYVLFVSTHRWVDAEVQLTNDANSNGTRQSTTSLKSSVHSPTYLFAIYSTCLRNSILTQVACVVARELLLPNVQYQITQ